MTISEFAAKTGHKTKIVKGWIDRGLIPKADISADYVPDSAREPYTKARAKTSDAIYESIVNAARNRRHVLPALYGIGQDEFNGYVDRLIESGLIFARESDGVVYYDATPKAQELKQRELCNIIESISRGCAEGVTTAMMKAREDKILS